MGDLVFYFSGTGNSLRAAEKICEGIGDCELVSIADAVLQGRYEFKGRRAGFIFPLYYLGLPKIVQEFINKLELKETDYTYTVITRGWPLVGGAIRQMKRLLRIKGMRLDMGAYIHMPMNDFTLANVPEPHKQKKILGTFSTQVDRIINLISLNRKKFDFEPIAFMLDKRNKPFIERVNTLDRYYSVNENCTGCNICADVCSVGNIELVDGNPEWKSKCEMCLACFHYCPQKAICYNGKCTEVYRYHHPDINIRRKIMGK
ncbi:MAG: EFR1 family ferrodoxin [Clostridia bacterium]|nr:EFR1 family ferrodoxin [Clostridia bacterium]